MRDFFKTIKRKIVFYVITAMAIVTLYLPLLTHTTTMAVQMLTMCRQVLVTMRLLLVIQEQQYHII